MAKKGETKFKKLLDSLLFLRIKSQEDKKC